MADREEPPVPVNEIPSLETRIERLEAQVKMLMETIAHPVRTVTNDA